MPFAETTSRLIFLIPSFLLLLVLVVAVVLLWRAKGSLVERVGCVLRQVARRWQWGVGLLVGLPSYAYWYEWRLSEAARRAASADKVDAMTAVAAKLVDPEQFYSKLAIATVVFSFINLCVWGTLVLVYGVIGRWAKGDYHEAKPDSDIPAVPDFKHTFLGLNGPARMAVMLGFIYVEAMMVGQAVEAAFKMQ